MNIEQLLSIGNAPLLALSLNAIGIVIKKSPINNAWIPILLMGLGSIGYPALENAWTVKAALCGMLIGGGAVGLNQALRQFLPAPDPAPAQIKPSS